MLDPKQLDDMARRLADGLPAGIRAMRDDVERNLRAGLQAAFARLDLVTREEFDVQTQLLARTRARLEQMEKLIAELERSVGIRKD